MNHLPDPAPGTAEQLRQEFKATIDHLWETEWSRRSEGDGFRWFRHAWRDTCRILRLNPPMTDETLAAYAERIRQALEAIHWRYAYDDPDDNCYVDEDSWYAAVMARIIAILRDMAADMRADAQRE